MSAAKREQFAEMVHNVLANNTVSDSVKRSVKDWSMYVDESTFMDFRTAAKVLLGICGIQY